MDLSLSAVAKSLCGGYNSIVIAQKEVSSMAKCTVCGKGVASGFQISHSHIRTKRTWSPNIQTVKAIVDGSPRRIKVCTKCLKSGKVTRAV